MIVLLGVSYYFNEIVGDRGIKGIKGYGNLGSVITFLTLITLMVTVSSFVYEILCGRIIPFITMRFYPELT